MESKDNIKDGDNSVSRRHWHLGATEVEFDMGNGTRKKCWVQSVLDANGERICFGKSSNMEFIVKMENEFTTNEAIPKKDS